jgi:hypothetical protein
MFYPVFAYLLDSLFFTFFQAAWAVLYLPIAGCVLFRLGFFGFCFVSSLSLDFIFVVCEEETICLSRMMLA